jgi:hypothetical protein
MFSIGTLRLIDEHEYARDHCVGHSLILKRPTPWFGSCKMPKVSKAEFIEYFRWYLAPRVQSLHVENHILTAIDQWGMVQYGWPEPCPHQPDCCVSDCTGWVMVLVKAG